MKKLIALLASSVTLMLAIGGLVVAQSASATTTEYPGTVATTCNLGWVKPVSHVRKARVKFSVVTAGTGTPAGVVKVTARTRNGRYHYARSYSYAGGLAVKPFRKMHRGRYVTRVFFTPTTGSVFMACSKTLPRLLRVR
jgi:hypothetical protein